MGGNSGDWIDPMDRLENLSVLGLECSQEDAKDNEQAEDAGDAATSATPAATAIVPVEYGAPHCSQCRSCQKHKTDSDRAFPDEPQWWGPASAWQLCGDCNCHRTQDPECCHMTPVKYGNLGENPLGLVREIVCNSQPNSTPPHLAPNGRGSWEFESPWNS